MKKKRNSGRIVEKATRAILARTPEGRANYAIDLFADELLQEPLLDELLHAVVEIGLGKGPLDKRVKRWVRKAEKHRR